MQLLGQRQLVDAACTNTALRTLAIPRRAQPLQKRLAVRVRERRCTVDDECRAYSVRDGEGAAILCRRSGPLPTLAAGLVSPDVYSPSPVAAPPPATSATEERTIARRCFEIGIDSPGAQREGAA